MYVSKTLQGKDLLSKGKTHGKSARGLASPGVGKEYRNTYTIEHHD